MFGDKYFFVEKDKRFILHSSQNLRPAQHISYQCDQMGTASHFSVIPTGGVTNLNSVMCFLAYFMEHNNAVGVALLI